MAPDKEGSHGCDDKLSDIPTNHDVDDLGAQPRDASEVLLGVGVPDDYSRGQKAILWGRPAAMTHFSRRWPRRASCPLLSVAISEHAPAIVHARGVPKGAEKGRVINGRRFLVSGIEADVNDQLAEGG